jgi:hypothetical protein
MYSDMLRRCSWFLLLTGASLACTQTAPRSDAAIPDGAAATEGGAADSGTDCPSQKPAPGAACDVSGRCGPYAGALHADCVNMCPSGCTGGGLYSVSVAALAECTDGRWSFVLPGIPANPCTRPPVCMCPAGSGGSAGHGSGGAGAGDAGL